MTKVLLADGMPKTFMAYGQMKQPKGTCEEWMFQDESDSSQDVFYVRYGFDEMRIWRANHWVPDRLEESMWHRADEEERHEFVEALFAVGTIMDGKKP
jgi:hypothetical protein